MPKQERSIIKVIGVGGGGGNAVTHMYKQGIKGVEFLICNTDNQAMNNSPIATKIQLGPHLTEGRGAGSKPEVGKQACIESIENIKRFLDDGTKMLFITAGMGGGTGTGAAPIIAKAAKELDILTVAIVTLPFKFEGLRRQRQALEGLEELKKNVDSILIISNDKMSSNFGNLVLTEAFGKADNILTTAAKGIAEIITVPGLLNVDFEDVNTVMTDSGISIMGNAAASGEGRARKAINEALNSPLLEETDIRGAQHILLNISSGTQEVTMDEIGEITEYIQEEAGYGTDLIWGNCKDDSLGDKLSVTLIATGFKSGQTVVEQRVDDKIKVPLDGRFELTEEDGITTGFAAGEQAQIIEFDNADEVSTRSFDTQEPTYAQKEPAERAEERAKQDENSLRRAELEAARREYLRNNHSKPLDNPKRINEIESVPAYKRREVKLEELNIKEKSNLSRYSVSMDDESPIQRNNQFLYDNVD